MTRLTLRIMIPMTVLFSALLVVTPPLFRNNADMLALVAYDAAWSSTHLTLVDTRTTHTVPITRPETGDMARYHNHPAWSPDGHKLAYFASGSDGPALWMMYPDGSGVRQLTPLPGQPTRRPKWSPDGESVTVPVLSEGRDFVVTVNISTGDVIEVAAQDGYSNVAVSPFWLPDEPIPYLSYGEGAMDFETIRLQEDVIFEGDQRFYNVSATPDGVWLAYADPVRLRSKVYLVNMVDGKVHVAGDSALIDLEPALAPGGNRLAFISNREGDWQIYVMDVPDGTARRITTVAVNPSHSLQWSSDEARIAFVAGGGGGVMMVEVDSGQVQPVRIADGYRMSNLPGAYALKP